MGLYESRRAKSCRGIENACPGPVSDANNRDSLSTTIEVSVADEGLSLADRPSHIPPEIWASATPKQRHIEKVYVGESVSVIAPPVAPAPPDGLSDALTRDDVDCSSRSATSLIASLTDSVLTKLLPQIVEQDKLDDARERLKTLWANNTSQALPAQALSWDVGRMPLNPS